MFPSCYSSVEHGYFEGALESGLRAAANVFRRIDRTFLARFETFLADGTQDRVKIREILLQENVHESSNTFCSLDVDYLLDYASEGEEEDPHSGSDDLSAPHLRCPAIDVRHHSATCVASLLPITLKALDHYTLICDDAKRVADFHIDVLGFRFVRIQEVNTGTVPNGEIDMLNYVLTPPGNPNVTMVVTEGLNDQTIFRKYMKKFGHGIHHVAFEVDNIAAAFATIRDYGITTTSPKITTDMLSGLKQFFIEPCHAGFFIELIERPDSVRHEGRIEEDSNFFTHDNMADLARSIAKHVAESGTPSSNTLATTREYSFQSVEEEKKDCSSSSHCSVPQNEVLEVGEIGAFTFNVAQAEKSAAFLTKFFNFRQIASEQKGNRLSLALPAQDMAFILQTATAEKQERSAAVSFAVHDDTKLRQGRCIIKGDDGSLKIPDEYASYDVLFVPAPELSNMSRVIKSCGMDLHVNIACDRDSVLDFLSDPANLPRWTGHRAIHFSRARDNWVETRTGADGQLKDFVLVVERMGQSIVKFEWPERSVKMLFDCLGRGENACTLVAKFPLNLPQGNLGRLKKVIAFELDVLKAQMEGNAASTIPSEHWHHIQSYHLASNGMSIRKSFNAKVVREAGFVGDIVQDGPLFEQMSTDFAKTIHSKPHAILRPTGLSDVRAAVKAAAALDLNLSARGSKVSHSAGGQAQADGGLLLDMSCLCGVEFSEDMTSVKIQTGTMWDEVIRETLKLGLIPPVINDYQYLSVGGTLSMGGVGFMSHYQGIQAGFVNKIEVVSGLGDVLVCSESQNKLLFDRARGGLGQFGIITSAEIPLVEAPARLQTYQCFYKHTEGSRFSQDIDRLVRDGRIPMIHSFLKPCTSVQKIVGDNAFACSSSTFQTAITDGMEAGSTVFFLELAIYLYDNEEDAKLVGDIQEMLLNNLGCLNNEIFTTNQDFAEYIHCDPPVVKTNQEHGSIPHPSLANVISREGAMQLIDQHLASPDRGDDKHNEILLIPMRSNGALGVGSHVPMFPMPENVQADDWSFFMLVLGSVLPGENAERDMERLRHHHRQLFETSQALGGKRYSYDTLTNEVRGEAAWKKHYGAVEWETICVAKRLYDPFHLLGSGVAMWD